MLFKSSPKDLLRYFSEIKKVKINDAWNASEINNDTKKPMEKLEVP